MLETPSVGSSCSWHFCLVCSWWEQVKRHGLPLPKFCRPRFEIRKFWCFWLTLSCSIFHFLTLFQTTVFSHDSGHAAANAVARLGGAISPFVVSNSFPMSVVGIIMASVSFVTFLLSWHFPETQGKALGTAHSGSVTSSMNAGIASIEPPSLELSSAQPNKTKEII